MSWGEFIVKLAMGAKDTDGQYINPNDGTQEASSEPEQFEFVAGTAIKELR